MFAIKSFDGAYLSNDGGFDFDRYELKAFENESQAIEYSNKNNVKIDNKNTFIVYIDSNDLYINN